MSRQESKEEEAEAEAEAEEGKEKEKGSCCMELRRCILDTRLRYASLCRHKLRILFVCLLQAQKTH